MPDPTVLVLPTVARPPAWRLGRSWLLGGVLCVAGFALTTATLLAARVVLAGADDVRALARYVAGALTLAVLALMVFCMVAALFGLMNWCWPQPSWGTAAARRVPVHRWSFDDDAVTQTCAVIEGSFAVEVLRPAGDSCWVLRRADGSLCLGTVVLVGEPGPDGVEAFLIVDEPAPVAATLTR